MIKFCVGLLAISTLCGCTNASSDAEPNANQVAEHPSLKRVMQSDVVDGATYEYLIDSPTRVPEKPLPVVIALHGRGGDGASAVAQFDLDSLAEQHPFILIAPTAQNHVWQDLTPPGAPNRDLKFFDRLLSRVAEFGGDPKLIYVTGFSNGGSMTHLLGSVFSDRLAGIAPGGASIGALDARLNYLTIPEPKNPIPVFMFHGMVDESCGYDMRTFTVAAPDTARWWAKRNGLSLTSIQTSVAKNKIVIDQFGDINGPEVVLMSYRNMGHSWPSTQDADTGTNFNEALWTFFAQHHLK